MPYPPGIPMVMSGENFGADGLAADRLPAQHAAPGAQFPGFAGVIEGAEMHDGTYHVYCLTK